MSRLSDPQARRRCRSGGGCFRSSPRPRDGQRRDRTQAHHRARLGDHAPAVMLGRAKVLPETRTVAHWQATALHRVQGVTNGVKGAAHLSPQRVRSGSRPQQASAL